jgi:hypothetical protein
MILPYFIVLICTLFMNGCTDESIVASIGTKPNGESSSINPESQVQEFYSWYLDQFTANSAAFRSPLADHVYRHSEYLTTGLIYRIDELLDGFSAVGYDPFLCAREIPSKIHVDGFLIDNNTAGVVVHTNYLEHTFSLELKLEDSRWLIDDVICAWTPEGTTRAFLIWYLANLIDPQTGKLRSLLDDERYYLTHYLTTSFLHNIKSLNGVDPVTFGKEFPKSFNLKPGPNRSSVIVQLVFPPGIPEKELLVSLVQETNKWVIDNISLMK